MATSKVQVRKNIYLRLFCTPLSNVLVIHLKNPLWIETSLANCSPQRYTRDVKHLYQIKSFLWVQIFVFHNKILCEHITYFPAMFQHLKIKTDSSNRMIFVFKTFYLLHHVSNEFNKKELVARRNCLHDNHFSKHSINFVKLLHQI